MTGSRTLTADETAALVQQVIELAPNLTSVLTDYPVQAERLADLPSYPEVEFSRIHVVLQHPGPTFVCAHTPTGPMLVDEASSIAELNRRVGLQLDDPDSVGDYLRDWFALQIHLRSWLAESPDQLEFSPSVIRLPGRQLVAEQAETLVHPMRVTGSAADGFRVVATVMDQQTLQSQVIGITSTGMVESISTTDLLTDVPVPYVLRR